MFTVTVMCQIILSKYIEIQQSTGAYFLYYHLVQSSLKLPWQLSWHYSYTSHTLPAPVYSFDLISFHHRLCLQAPWCQIILTGNGKWFHFVALLINAPGSTLSTTSEIPAVSRFKAVCHFWFLFMCRKGNISRAGSPFCFAHRLFNQSKAGFFPTEVFNNSSNLA